MTLFLPPTHQEETSETGAAVPGPAKVSRGLSRCFLHPTDDSPWWWTQGQSHQLPFCFQHQSASGRSGGSRCCVSGCFYGADLFTLKFLSWALLKTFLPAAVASLGFLLGNEAQGCVSGLFQGWHIYIQPRHWADPQSSPWCNPLLDRSPFLLSLEGAVWRQTQNQHENWPGSNKFWRSQAGQG